jgi:hypothetical protein
VADRLWSSGVRWLYFDTTGYRVGSLEGERLTDEGIFRVRPEDDALWRALLAARAGRAMTRGSVTVYRLIGHSQGPGVAPVQNWK